MGVDGAVNGPTFIRFLERLIREARSKVFLIVDRLKAHRAWLVRDWLEAHRSEIEVHYLPSYSHELNPDEGVDADRKQALPRQKPARSKEQLRRAADRHMPAWPGGRSGSAPASDIRSSATPHDQDNEGRINNRN